MNISDFGNTQSGKSRLKKRRITGLIVIAVIILLGAYLIGILTTDRPEYQMRATAIEENHILKERIAELEAENEELKEQLNAIPTPEPTENADTPRSTVAPTVSE